MGQFCVRLPAARAESSIRKPTRVAATCQNAAAPWSAMSAHCARTSECGKRWRLKAMVRNPRTRVDDHLSQQVCALGPPLPCVPARHLHELSVRGPLCSAQDPGHTRPSRLQSARITTVSAGQKPRESCTTSRQDSAVGCDTLTWRPLGLLSRYGRRIPLQSHQSSSLAEEAQTDAAVGIARVCVRQPPHTQPRSCLITRSAHVGARRRRSPGRRGSRLSCKGRPPCCRDRESYTWGREPRPPPRPPGFIDHESERGYGGNSGGCTRETVPPDGTRQGSAPVGRRSTPDRGPKRTPRTHKRTRFARRHRPFKH